MNTEGMPDTRITHMSGAKILGLVVVIILILLALGLGRTKQAVTTNPYDKAALQPAENVGQISETDRAAINAARTAPAAEAGSGASASTEYEAAMNARATP